MPLRDPKKGLVIIRRGTAAGFHEWAPPGVHGVSLDEVLERLDPVIPDDADVEIEEPLERP